MTGGAPQFLSFIETQLIPKMEQDYNADTTRASRVILGHSYGGLFGGYAYCVNNKVFGNYILLSPSFWFDNLVELQMEKDNRAINKNKSNWYLWESVKRKIWEECKPLLKHFIKHFVTTILK